MHSIIHFVGAGPGDPELLTVKAVRLLAEAEVVFYAGSLIPPAILSLAPRAEKIDTATLALPAIIAHMVQSAKQAKKVIRMVSGDPSLYSAMQEQKVLLAKQGISIAVVPGISAYCAAAAQMGLELTLPQQSQSIILTRTSVRTGAMPEGENLLGLAQNQSAMLVIHLAAANSKYVAEQLSTARGRESNTAIAYKIGWHDEKIIFTNPQNLQKDLKNHGITRHALIMNGPALAGLSANPHAATPATIAKPTQSYLYNPLHKHLFRTPIKSAV